MVSHLYSLSTKQTVKETRSPTYSGPNGEPLLFPKIGGTKNNIEQGCQLHQVPDPLYRLQGLYTDGPVHHVHTSAGGISTTRGPG